MTDPTDLDLDTAISADLDDVLDDLCVEQGLDAAAVRARLATPAADARRAELTAARDAVATPVPPLDDLARRRLLGATLADADPDTTIPVCSGGSHLDARTGRRWAVIAAVAAAMLVVVGIFAVVRGGGGDSASKSSGSSTASVPKGDLGDVGNLDEKSVDALVNGGGGTSTSASAAEGASAPTAEGFTPKPDAVPAAQVKACATRFADRGTVRFQASGEFQGAPAVILGIDTDTRTIVFVVAADDCSRVLYSASR